mmetsp:Transcript_6141/g.14626  ORF Transcript_6141/g.14626 Transcript_6141/m.14626 type:complete len:224 (+) Transcript_6141:142-813(+)
MVAPSTVQVRTEQLTAKLVLRYTSSVGGIDPRHILTRQLPRSTESSAMIASNSCWYLRTSFSRASMVRRRVTTSWLFTSSSARKVSSAFLAPTSSAACCSKTRFSRKATSPCKRRTICAGSSESSATCKACFSQRASKVLSCPRRAVLSALASDASSVSSSFSARSCECVVCAACAACAACVGCAGCAGMVVVTSRAACGAEALCMVSTRPTAAPASSESARH